MKSTSRSTLRMIGAIAAKDILDAIKNKSILSNLISVLFIIVLWQTLPSLYKGGSTNLIVWDPAESRLSAAIDADSRYRLLAASSREIFLELVGEEQGPVLGIMVPYDLDQALAADESIVLEGYLPWAARHEAAEVQAEYEAVFTQMLGQTVQLQLDGNLVYPHGDGMGEHVMLSITQVAPMMILCLAVVPLLVVEEKQTRTMDVLLVSPAGPWEVAAGKALAGIFYGLLFSALALILAWNSIAHWWLAILGVLLGLLGFVLLGLLVGSLVDHPQQMTIWMMPVMAVLLIPVILNALEGLLPDAVAQGITWLPSVALSILIRSSYLEVVEAKVVWRNLLLVIMWIIPVCLFLVRRMRRLNG